MSDTVLSLLLVLGSVRRDRAGTRLTRYLERQISARGIKAVLLDPMVLNLPLLDRMYKEYPRGEAPNDMETAAGFIRSADGVIVVSAEYNHGIPPALKNTLDHFLEEWFHKPAGIATYSAGRFGGVRAAMQLRMTLAELGMPMISTLLPVPEITAALDGDSNDQSGRLGNASHQFLTELEWWCRAAKTELASSGPPFGGSNA